MVYKIFTPLSDVFFRSWWNLINPFEKPGGGVITTKKGFNKSFIHNAWSWLAYFKVSTNHSQAFC